MLLFRSTRFQPQRHHDSQFNNKAVVRRAMETNTRDFNYKTLLWSPSIRAKHNWILWLSLTSKNDAPTIIKAMTGQTLVDAFCLSGRSLQALRN